MTKKTLFKAAGLILGLSFLTFAVTRLGPGNILSAFLRIRWWAPAVLFNSFLWFLLYTAAWRNYFSNLEHKIPFLHLLRIKICGEAINLSTPIGFVAGDPVRMMLLQKQLGRATRLGSVIVDRLLHSLATVTFVLTGVVVASVHAVGISGGLRGGIFLIYLGVVSVLGFVVIELVKGNGLKLFHPFFCRLGLTKRFPSLEEHLADLNVELSGFAGGSLLPFVRSFIYHFGGRVLGAVEIALIFTALSGAPHIVLAVILASVTSVVHFLFAFIPGGIGLVESLYGGFFYLHGLDPALGVSMQLLRRMRALFWVATGYLLMHLKRRRSDASTL